MIYVRAADDQQPTAQDAWLTQEILSLRYAQPSIVHLEGIDLAALLAWSRSSLAAGRCEPLPDTASRPDGEAAS